MTSISTTADLKNVIKQLELQQASELLLMKEEFLNTADSLKPINIIKNTFKEAVNVPDLKTDVINTAIGLTTGILAKKIIIGKTLNPLSKLAGVVLELFVANKTSKNATAIKSIGGIIMNKLFSRSAEPENHDGKPI